MAATPPNTFFPAKKVFKKARRFKIYRKGSASQYYL